MAKTRRAYTGGAASTTTSSNILSSGTTSFTITAYTGWPYGSDPFFVVVEPGTANEEKILVTRTGSTDTTINVYATPSVAANRGADGTSSVAHSSGVTVFPVFTALDADEANELTSAWSTKGDLVSYGSSTFETLGVGSDDAVLIADSGEASGLNWSSSLDLAGLSVDTDTLFVDATNDRVGVNDATPSYALDVTGDINATGDLRIGGTAIGEYIDYSASVTFNNFTLGNGTATAYYTRVNDLVHFVGTVNLGSTSSVTGSWSVNLPVNSAFSMTGHGFVHFNDSGTDVYLGTLTTGATSAAFKWFGVIGSKISENGVNATLPFTWTTGDFLRWDFLYRAA